MVKISSRHRSRRRLRIQLLYGDFIYFRLDQLSSLIFRPDSFCRQNNHGLLLWKQSLILRIMLKVSKVKFLSIFGLNIISFEKRLCLLFFLSLMWACVLLVPLPLAVSFVLNKGQVYHVQVTKCTKRNINTQQNLTTS